MPLLFECHMNHQKVMLSHGEVSEDVNVLKMYTQRMPSYIIFNCKYAQISNIFPQESVPRHPADLGTIAFGSSAPALHIEK